MNYYNEWDKGAAAWLRELIKAGHLPQGYVDERSITEVTASDLAGFTQCHFFAGIGGWPLALYMAGIRSDQRLWTGSPPCQPFSVAGKQLGQLDERHLAPAFMRLVDQCRPPVLFGEQVAAAIGKHWLDDLFAELERQGYACGAAVLPAASVGAPHKRDRLFFGAVGHSNGPEFEARIAQRIGDEKGSEQSAQPGLPVQLAYADREQREGSRDVRQRRGFESSNGGVGSGMADTDDARPQGRRRVSERTDQQPAGAAGMAGGVAKPNSQQQRPDTVCRSGNEHVPGGRHEGSAAATRLRGHSELADTNGEGWRDGRQRKRGMDECDRPEAPKRGERGGSIERLRPSDPPGKNHGFWSDADWLRCRDGKFRPVESGTFPLANGVPARVGRLRGYGNAIVPQVAAEFIKAFTGACADAGN